MIKLIASDLDGTLLNDNKELSPDFFEILEELDKRNILFVPSSGRSQFTIGRLFEPYNKNVCYISDNGAYISGCGIDVVNFPMTHEQSVFIAERCLEVDCLQIVMCTKSKAYFLRVEDRYKDIILEYYANFEYVDNPDNIREDVLKIAVFDPAGSGEHGYPEVKDYIRGDLVGVVSSQNWFDIMDRRVNKGYALSQLQKKFGILSEETMAFGDFNNDIEMLKQAKYSFAMENASQSVKDAANFEAPDNNSFGVSKIIRDFVLEQVCLR